MKYALLIYSAPPAPPEAGAAAASPVDGEPDGRDPEAWEAYTRALKSAGALLALERLQAVETATAVRVRGGERLLTDGPFIETKEHLLGFYLIEAPGLDAAIEWAARMPHVHHGTVEVRPVMPSPFLTQLVAE
jgi:hypothetical protein